MKRKTKTLVVMAMLAVGCGEVNDVDWSDPVERIQQAATVDYTKLPNDSTMTIQSAADVATKRAAIIQYLWGSAGFPSTKLPTNPVAINFDELQLKATLPNYDAGRSKRVTMSMDKGEKSVGYLFMPTNGNGQAVILNPGHGCHLNDPDKFDDPDAGAGLTATLSALIGDGYAVMLVFMPRYTPIDCVGGAPHQTMFDIIPTTGKPMKFFMEPSAMAVNYLKALSPPITKVGMVGLSGGGWTTTLYAAIDTRVGTTISVAGSMPLFLSPRSAWAGDYEQVWPEFYQQHGYLDLYVMASFGSGGTSGRKHIQVLNRHDDCCFSAEAPLQDWSSPTWEADVRTYENQVRLKLKTIGANDFFRVEIDEAMRHHGISRQTAVGVIAAELNGSRRIGSVSANHAFVRGLEGNLWHWIKPGPWKNTGLKAVGVPAVLEGATAHGIDVFYRDQSNRPMHAWPSGTGYVSEPLGGPSVVLTDLAATSWGPGRWDVTALGGETTAPFRGMGRYTLWHWWVSGTSSIQRELVMDPVRAVGAPAIATSGPNQLDIVYRAFNRDVFSHRSTGQAPWSSATPLNAQGIVDLPALIARPDGPTLRVYTRGLDKRLWEAVRVPSGSWSWVSISGATGQNGVALVGSPSAAMAGDATVRVCLRMATGNVGTFKLNPLGVWTFTNDQSISNAAPTAFAGGEWIKGLSGGAWSFNPANSTWTNNGGKLE